MISVIVPLYNNEDYIENCLKSIISQSYNNIEIIVVNDGSTDESLKIVKKIAITDFRIRIIDRENGGCSVARNTGIEASTGEFLMFVDGDDELEENAIDNLYAAIVRDNADISVGSVSVVYEVHEELKETDNYYYTIKSNKCINIDDDIISSIHGSAYAKLFRRNIIDKYNMRFPEGLRYEDVYWHWTYLSSSKVISCIKNSVYKYYRHKNSLMSSTFDFEKNLSIQHLYICDKIFEFWTNYKVFEHHRKTAGALLEKFFWFSFRYAKSFDRIKTIYECERIATKYSLKTDNGTICKICDGNIAFLFSQDKENANNDLQYSTYLQIKEVINQCFPLNSRRRKWIYCIARFFYHLIKK